MNKERLGRARDVLMRAIKAHFKLKTLVKLTLRLGLDEEEFFPAGGDKDMGIIKLVLSYEERDRVSALLVELLDTRPDTADIHETVLSYAVACRTCDMLNWKHASTYQLAERIGLTPP